MMRHAGPRWRFLLPVVAAFGLALAIVPTTHALWFQTLSAGVTVTTGAATASPVVATPSVGPRLTRTAQPTSAPATSTPEPCENEFELEFSNDSTTAGDGPLQTTFSISNTGTGDAFDVVLGLHISEGQQFVSRVDFDNGQTWITNGLPVPTMFLIEALPAGSTHAVTLTVTLSDAWLTEQDAEVQIDVAVAQARCSDAGGDELEIVLLHGERTATAIPSVAVTTTAYPSSTVTRTRTATKTPTTATPTPASTGTVPATPGTGEPSAAASMTAVTSTEIPSETATAVASAIATRTPPQTATPSKTNVADVTATPPSSSTATATSSPTDTPVPTMTGSPAPLATGTPAVASPSASPTRRTTAVPTSTETPPPPSGTPPSPILGSTMAASPIREVLGAQGTKPGARALPDTGSGFPDGVAGNWAALLIALAALGVLGLALSVLRRKGSEAASK